MTKVTFRLTEGKIEIVMPNGERSEVWPNGPAFRAKEVATMGGKPSTSTPADHRLKENKGKPPASPLFGGKKAPPFGKK